MSKKARQYAIVAIIALVVTPLISALTRLGISIWANHGLYEKVQTFTPAEDVICRVDLVEQGHHSETRTLDLASQQKLQGAVADLAYGGYYAVDPLWPFFKNTLSKDHETYTDTSYYYLYIGLGNTGASIRVQEDMCFDWPTQSKYVLKYDNYETLFKYCEDLFGSTETSNQNRG